MARGREVLRADFFHMTRTMDTTNQSTIDHADTHPNATDANRDATQVTAILLPSTLEESLRKVIAHLWDDQYRDYQRKSTAGRDDHICRHLHRLRVWLRYPEAITRKQQN